MDLILIFNNIKINYEINFFSNLINNDDLNDFIKLNFQIIFIIINFHNYSCFFLIINFIFMFSQ